MTLNFDKACQDQADVLFANLTDRMVTGDACIPDVDPDGLPRRPAADAFRDGLRALKEAKATADKILAEVGT